MRFRVENLGPLREAEVDLEKDLIVLTGPNNTGKTYLAWCLYGLLRPALGEVHFFKDYVFNDFLNSDREELDLIATHPDWEKLFQRIAEHCQARLSRVFAAGPEQFANTTVSLRETQGVAARVTAQLPAIWNELVGTRPHPLGKITPREKLNYLPLLFWGRAFPRCALFPAERIALNMFAREVALNRTELIDELLEKPTDPTALLQRRVGRYSWPIRDNLMVANDLTEFAKTTTTFCDIAEDLERVVLGGQVVLSDTGSLTFSPNQAMKLHLPIHLTASVVKSLVSLVFYFRHQAREHDFLIIDEPELNLHPDAQRRVIRVLAKAVNRGFKIMMSTHSDYVLRELNHLVMLSDPKESVSRVVDQLGYDRASILPPEKVGVYLFKDQTAKEVPVTVDGFEVETIEQEIAKLNADAQAIYAARCE